MYFSAHFALCEMRNLGSNKIDKSVTSQPMEESEAPRARCLQWWRRLRRRRFRIWRSCDPKEAATTKAKARSKYNSELQAHQTKPKTSASYPQEKRTACNAEQASAEKAVPGFDGCARTSSWSASKAIQTESIAAFIYPFSKIIREGPTVYYCDHVTNVTYKIQYKYPNCNFSKILYRILKQNIPMAKILSELKKGDAGF